MQSTTSTAGGRDLAPATEPRAGSFPTLGSVVRLRVRHKAESAHSQRSQTSTRDKNRAKPPQNPKPTVPVPKEQSAPKLTMKLLRRRGRPRGQQPPRRTEESTTSTTHMRPSAGMAPTTSSGATGGEQAPPTHEAQEGRRHLFKEHAEHQHRFKNVQSP